MTRKAAFFYRSHDGLLGCPECGFTIDSIPEDWLITHVGEHIGCPGCGLSSRIPTPQEAYWPERKAYGDSMKDVPIVEREGARLSAV